MTTLRKMIGVMVAMGLTASSVLAAFDYQVRIERGDYQEGSGGEFRAVSQDGNPGGHLPGAQVFQTFCTERNESLRLGRTYDAMINTMTRNSNVTLTNAVAFLYTEFRAGTLDDYRFNGTQDQRKDDAGELQNMIWFLLGENNNFDAENSKFWDSLEDEFGLNQAGDNLSASAFASDNLGKVRVLNLLDGNGDPAQDQLIIVPIPGAAALGAIGVGVLGLIRRRRA